MTRKDFQLIASILREAAERHIIEPGSYTQSWLVERFTEALYNTNPQFNASRFRHACLGNITVVKQK
jgi:hypothetical protein